jgi:superfamily II DNA or RNA helicase
MLILQGSWLDGRLQIWGETAPRAAPATPRRSPRRDRILPDLSPLAPSPFDADAALLGQVTAVLAGSRADGRARHARPGVAWLPCHSGLPIPAQPGFLPPDWPFPGPDAPPQPLRPWRVTRLPLSWPETCVLLATCSNGPELGRRLHVGRSLMVWSRLWRLAGALVARQAYLPDIQRTGGGHFESFWRPVLDADDERRLTHLTAALPPAACALASELARPAAMVDEAARLAIARDFLEQAVDRLVRSAVTTPLTRAQARKGQLAGAHAAWLASLRTDGRRIRWDEVPEDLEQLATALAAWRRPLMIGQAGNCRLMFRLEEPAAPCPAVWQLLISVETGSPPRQWPIHALKQAPPRIREYALTALGQAVTLCPCLRAHESEAAATGVPLDTGEAYNFLAQDVAILRSAGFAVEVPAWWRNPSETNPVRLRALLMAAQDDPDSFARLGLDQLAEVNWTLVLGGQAITPEALKALLESRQPLIHWQGRWIAIDRTEALAAIRQLRKRRICGITLRDLLRLAVGGEADDGVRIETADLTRQGPIGDWLDRLRGDTRIDPLAPPEAFSGELRPYQQRGYAWLAWLRRWGLGACLADDMGLGKTIQALALFQHARDRGLDRPILLVCPLSLIANWRHESSRFTPRLTMLTHYGSDRAFGRVLLQEAAQHDIVITSYTLLCRDFATLNHVHWSMVVLDEAQNIKNPATLQSRAARALTADFRLALTGTPLENQVGDLWALMDFLNPGLLGTRAQFNHRFHRPIRTGVDSGARTVLRQITAPFILRRLKRDPEVIADLPDRVENKVFCSLTPEQAALYASELHRLEAGLGTAVGRVRRGFVLATLTRLKQICNHPLHYLRGVAGEAGEAPAHPQNDAHRSGKLTRLNALVEEVIANGESALIFTQYAVMGTLLQEHLRERIGCEIPFLHGGVGRDARTTMIDRFQQGSGPPLFILSLKAGGTGLNLTRANHVFHYDRWWNPAVENQATDRVHRIGQTRHVFVHKFICSGTLEARIDALIESKLALADDLVGSGEAWLSELSNDKLREVLALSADAVAGDEEEWT